MKCNFCRTNEARPSSAYCEECAPDRVLSATLLADVDSQIAQALDHQNRLTRDAEMLKVRCEVVGEYRVRFQNLRDRLCQQLEMDTPK